MYLKDPARGRPSHDGRELKLPRPGYGQRHRCRPSHDGRELKHDISSISSNESPGRPSHDGRELKLLFVGFVEFVRCRPSHDGRELKRVSVPDNPLDETVARRTTGVN